jgi:hypothetical protein
LGRTLTDGGKIMTILAEPPSISAAVDRCDRCGVQPRVRIILASGQDLLFCGHHAMEHHEALERIAVWIGEVAATDRGSREPSEARGCSRRQR